MSLCRQDRRRLIWTGLVVLLLIWIPIGVLLYAQEAHTWVLWSEQLGDWHKVSKIQIEERCYIIIEGWTKTHDSLVMHVEQTPCPARHP